MRKDGSEDVETQAKPTQFDTRPAHDNHPVGPVGWDKDGGLDFKGQLMIIQMARFQLAPVTITINLLYRLYPTQYGGSSCLAG